MKITLKVAKSLRANKKTLSLAESCSGGLLSHTLTNIPGSSNFLKGSVVAYSNEIKTTFLKIPKKDIINYGAVSLQVAKKMAKNIRKLFKTDFGVGITGIAGPGGATKNKQVGLVFISVDSKKNNLLRKFNFKGSRTKIKELAAQNALKMLYQLV